MIRAPSNLPTINVLFIAVEHTQRRPCSPRGCLHSLLHLNQPIEQGVNTGAGMVVLDPPVTVANIVPGSPYDFFLVKRIHEV